MFLTPKLVQEVLSITNIRAKYSNFNLRYLHPKKNSLQKLTSTHLQIFSSKHIDKYILLISQSYFDYLLSTFQYELKLVNSQKRSLKRWKWAPK